METKILCIMLIALAKSSFLTVVNSFALAITKSSFIVDVRLTSFPCKLLRGTNTAAIEG